jgi:excisionase family DNA binding protein
MLSSLRAPSLPKLYTPRDAAQVLGVNYSTLKQWIYHGKLKSVQTAGGHHRIPESEVDRLLPRIATSVLLRSGAVRFAASADAINSSGVYRHQNQRSGCASNSLHRRAAHYLDHHSRCSKRAASKKGQIAAALIKSTDVMVIIPG